MLTGGVIRLGQRVPPRPAPGPAPVLTAGPRHSSAASSFLTCAIWPATAGSAAGYFGLIASSAVTRTAAVASRVNHLWSAGTTYHGAHLVLVWLSMSSKARW